MKLAAPTNYPWYVMTDPYRPEGHLGGRHSGIDHGHGEGLAIYAPLPGRIVERRYHFEWGNRLVIEYRPGINVTVNHLASLTDTPRLGETVRQSQRIGTMGETGKAFGVHSHMELERGGRGPAFRVDPTPYFTQHLPGTEPGNPAPHQPFIEGDEMFIANIKGSFYLIVPQGTSKPRAVVLGADSGAAESGIPVIAYTWQKSIDALKNAVSGL